jgi:sugar phosphate isomerase/epimerase
MLGVMLGRFRFAYSTNAYTEVPLSLAVHEIARSGFDGVEILADLPHLNPMRHDVRAARRVSELIQRLGLAVSNVNVNTNLALSRQDPEGFAPSLIDRSGAARQARIDYVARALRLSREMEARNAAVALGRAPRGEGRDALIDRAAESFRKVMAHAEKTGVRVGIEYEPGHFVENHAQLLDLLDRVGHPMLGANLDIGHAVCAGEDVPAVIRALRGRIWNFHFEDIRGGVHDHLVPGLGDVDFEPILRAILETGYVGHLTLELYPYKTSPTWAGKTGLAHLRGVADRLDHATVG